jgi:hypothetical protein
MGLDQGQPLAIEISVLVHHNYYALIVIFPRELDNTYINKHYCLIVMPSCGVLVAISLALALLILISFSNLSSLWIHPAHALSDFKFDDIGDWVVSSKEH